MFKSKKQAINPDITDTLVGEGSTVDGKLRSSAGIRIEGHVTGDVECDGDVMIGEQGMVKSSITARNVLLAGTVHGNITAREKLTIHSNGKLYGDTSARTLVIEDGGIFQGTSRMGTEESPKDTNASVTDHEQGKKVRASQG